MAIMIATIAAVGTGTVTEIGTTAGNGYRGNGYYGNGYYNQNNGWYDRKGNFYPNGANGYYDKHGKWHYSHGQRDHDRDER